MKNRIKAILITIPFLVGFPIIFTVGIFISDIMVVYVGDYLEFWKEAKEK